MSGQFANRIQVGFRVHVGKINLHVARVVSTYLYYRDLKSGSLKTAHSYSRMFKIFAIASSALQGRVCSRQLRTNALGTVVASHCVVHENSGSVESYVRLSGDRLASAVDISSV